jgi:lysophospholipid acyltransferase (LPLAT)-like uncharacterized protein
VAADATADRRIAWLARGGGAFLRALGATWRFHAINDGPLRALRAAKKPFIFMLWHGQLLPLLYRHRGEGVAVLISEHGDGEIIARIAMGLGYQTVRGSSSRGAARALLGLARAVEGGHDLAITPDGPRGPAKSFAPGALVVAQRTGVPLIAVSASVTSAWRLNSWDGFIIPRPFARITVSYSEPLYVQAKNAREAASDSAVERARRVLMATEERAHG